MNTTLHQNRPEDKQNWTNLYLEPYDYWIHYVNIDLRHQYGISVFWVAEVPSRETSLAAKSEEKRMFSQARSFATVVLWSTFCKPWITEIYIVNSEISPEASLWGAHIQRGLYTWKGLFLDGNLHVKIPWAFNWREIIGFSSYTTSKIQNNDSFLFVKLIACQ